MKLLYCPICGNEDFEEYEGNDNQVAAIYCIECPYGVEDSTKTLQELRKIHNTRYINESTN